MSKSFGLEEVLVHLEYERDRFLRAGQSGWFCDSKSCLDTAYVIGKAIEEVSKVRKDLDC